MSGVPYNTYHGQDSGPPPPYTGIAFPMGYASPPYGYADPYSNASYGPPGFVAPQYHFPGTYPAPPPADKSGMPGVHVQNQFGGIGLPPGYNYLFPTTHCLVHVFVTGSTPPWQANSPLHTYDGTNHRKFFIPATMTVKEMMQQLGCSNEDADKNVMTEVQEVGNGKWTKGMVFKGGNKDRMKMTLKDLGWDTGRKRTGLPGQSPLIWVYITGD
ncbi:hypothetical protein SS1G_11147 [Sclerotinia sclerotiorum 1980 UF-70]|uniref:Uncharacterized protein n=2 Tax=Sclerotinia sclerotiorum (strain ATCC 18683 / 1980 / Ss-1) TaxID=665079 RepID=A7F0M9_SCLS1|nr:hypothetical protein SS1G_11147 [Sclerotinia sclerotiorum 1980 UF-70]APA14029.1 hypothetical protein sscle_12g087990 [Sclerotinia sclerotiorum 1980 UF-70]EDN95271.1 hypothetical protein SS1G_11147 [Sclerotinia sclerotiorum 1980 UF-70]